MKIAKTMRNLSLAASLFAMTTNASPIMVPIDEAAAEASVNLNIVNRSDAVAAVLVDLDLFGLLTAWSEAVPLNTRPFVGTVILIR